MKLPTLKIKNRVAKIPIVQGGMSIRLSMGRLAGVVASTGAVGTIGASGLEHDELRREIKIARDLAQGGIIGINILYAAKDFWGVVKTALAEKIDFIATGAGFSREIYKVVKEFGEHTAILPIVSSARLARVALKLGADAIIVEGKEAGGHLGTTTDSIKKLIPEVKEVVQNKVPIIGAGGITDGKDIVDILKLGADAAQIATRFILSEECAAAPEYKALHQAAKKPEDVILITSPVGMPGRALRSKFTEKIVAHQAPKPTECDFCLKNCSLEYCIIKALINAKEGLVDEGVVFSGEHTWKIKDKSIRPAADIVRELVAEAEAILENSS